VLNLGAVRVPCGGSSKDYANTKPLNSLKIDRDETKQSFRDTEIGMSENLQLTVVNSALLEVPVFENHFRGQNWLAVIGIDPCCPGGLSRRWLPKANGGGYIVTDIQLHDPLEFGADYKTSLGRKHPKRWYGVVIEKRIDSVEHAKGTLIVKPCESGRDACLESITLKEKRA
jgi:hypothetical protein